MTTKYKAVDYNYLRKLPKDAMLSSRDLRGLYCIKTQTRVSSRINFPKPDVYLSSTFNGGRRPYWYGITILNEIERQESMLYAT